MKDREFDYVIVGAGAAGAILAARLGEDPSMTVALLEAGPSDEGNARILELRNWADLLDSEFDFEYRVSPDEPTNPAMTLPRARVLGGCTSHNAAIAFRAPEPDLDRWEALGATGWSAAGTGPFFERLAQRVRFEPAPGTNACAQAFVAAAEQSGFARLALKDHYQRNSARVGVGWFQLNKKGGGRQSSSVSYLHPAIALPKNLHVLTNTLAHRLLFDAAGEPTGLETDRGRIFARCEIILSAGAFNTPKLLMLSGIGPGEHLRELGIEIVRDLPGVGRHLVDHVEGLVMWEASRPVPADSVQDWEAGLFAAIAARNGEPDVMFHFGTVPYDSYTRLHGYPLVSRAFCLAPNVMYPKSEGWMQLRSRDPLAAPVIRPRYLSDPEGLDARLLVEGTKLARRLAEASPLREWIAREIAPGPAIRSDAEILEYTRKIANSVYHPAGTCRMGDVTDPRTVVGPDLKVVGFSKLRVADASIFPEMIGVNIGITCMMIGEKAAGLVRA